MVRQGPGPFLVRPIVEEAQRSLVVKLMDPARKALSQLYRSEVPAESRRLLLVRWKLPEEIAANGAFAEGKPDDSVLSWTRPRNGESISSISPTTDRRTLAG
jgi:hypothetical protein